jgi:hypothetical protein
LQLIGGLPDGVIGLEASGEVSADDYTEVLNPALDAEMEDRGAVRLLYVLGEQFEGFTGEAMWEDAKTGASHAATFERVAVVTDHVGYRAAIVAFGWLMLGDVQEFALHERDDAIAWVTG